MKLLFENWRRLLKEGDVIDFPGNEYERIRRQTGIRLPLKPGGPAYKGGKEEVQTPAEKANKVENAIQIRMIKEYSNVEEWTEEQATALDQISDLLNIIFPSGE